MNLKKSLSLWAQKFIYGWLIVCIAGVGSLTCFDNFLPESGPGQHPYHLAILEQILHTHDHSRASLLSAPQAEALAQQLSLWRVSRFRMGLDTVVAQPAHTPGLAQFFTSGLNQGYLLTKTRCQIFNNIFLVGSVSAIMITGRSAVLPPPKKPPQANLA